MKSIELQISFNDISIGFRVPFFGKEIKQHPSNLSIREQVDRVIKRNKHDWWEHLPQEIELLSDPIVLPANTYSYSDCGVYAFGKLGAMGILPNQYPEAKVDEPKDGDYVFYYSENKDPHHVGVMQKDGKVISRWGGGGPILKHSVNSVPSTYGSVIKYFRFTERQLESIPDNLF